jgi:two-component system sensor kinase FixL
MGQDVKYLGIGPKITVVACALVMSTCAVLRAAAFEHEPSAVTPPLKSRDVKDAKSLICWGNSATRNQEAASQGLITTLFDTSDFPPRWYCGNWSDVHGWTHIVSDFAIFGAYAAIPLLLAHFVLQRRDVPFLPIFWLFVGFIFFCGFGHLVEATIFWQPWYRFSALVKACTAIFSWITVFALVPTLPKALALPGMATINRQLEVEIAERKQAQERSHEQAARIQAILDNVADAIITINNDGIVESVNNAGVKMFGYTADELVGMNVKILMPEPFRSEHDNYLRNYMQTGVAKIIGIGREVTAVHKNGTVFPVELAVSGVILHDRRLFTGVVRDITQRKRAEVALRESEARKAAMLDTAMDAVVTIDHEGKIVDFNPAAEQMFGCRRQDALGQMMAELIIPTHLRSEHYAGVARYLATEEATILNRRIELTAVRADGSEFPVDVAITRLAHDGPPLFTGYLRDITQRKQAENELLRANEELARRASAIERFNRQLARSNDELKQFAYVASHDLQEPLRKVTSFCEMLREEYRDKLDGEACTYIEYAVNGALRMKALISDLLDYSRVETQGKPLSPIAADEALAEAIDNLEMTMNEANATVQCDRLPVIAADRAQLVRLFQNLIGNAIKYRSDAPPQIHVWAEAHNDEWIIHVEDNGIGIDPQYHARIFVIFQRLHSREAYAGTGIGLAVCKRIVERFGGRIWVNSELGRGSDFCFALPKVESATFDVNDQGPNNEIDHGPFALQAH